MNEVPHEVVFTPIWLIHLDSLFKFFITFLAGAVLVGLPKYLNNLPKDEEISKRYLYASILMHGGLGSMSGIALLFLPTDNLYIIIGLSIFTSYFGADVIKKIALSYVAQKMGIKLNGNGNGKKNGDGGGGVSSSE